MTSSVRSTESALKLLLLRNARTSTASRAYKGKALQSDNLKGISMIQTIQKRTLSSISIRKPKIKFIDLSEQRFSFLKNLSTTTVQPETPISDVHVLINPDKPDPDYERPIAPMKRPLTMPRFTDNKRAIPSVTKVLQATMPAQSAFLLEKWKEAMIKKLGSAGFAKYQKETFERGHVLHSLIANYLLGSSEPIDGQGQLSREIVSNLWRSIEKVVKEKVTNVRLIEHIVNHPTMNYRGIVDCVACFNNELVVIDFKTSEKPKKNVESLYDNPLQVTAYCGAINNDKSIPLDVIDRNICAGVVIVAYIDGSEASTYFISREETAKYWKQWTTRLDQYTRLVNKTIK